MEGVGRGGGGGGGGKGWRGLEGVEGVGRGGGGGKGWRGWEGVEGVGRGGGGGKGWRGWEGVEGVGRGQTCCSCPTSPSYNSPSHPLHSGTIVFPPSQSAQANRVGGGPPCMNPCVRVVVVLPV